MIGITRALVLMVTWPHLMKNCCSIKAVDGCDEEEGDRLMSGNYICVGYCCSGEPFEGGRSTARGEHEVAAHVSRAEEARPPDVVLALRPRSGPGSLHARPPWRRLRRRTWPATHPWYLTIPSQLTLVVIIVSRWDSSCLEVDYAWVIAIEMLIEWWGSMKRRSILMPSRLVGH